MGHTDAMLARLTTELEERSGFQDGLVAAANEQNRDLNQQEMELFTRAGDRSKAIQDQIDKLSEQAQLTLVSEQRTKQLTEMLTSGRVTAQAQGVEYRSAGEFVMDMWKAGLRDPEAMHRQDVYLRAAAHQTTADNLGVIPEPLIGPVLNFIDASRPLVDVLGVRPVPGASFNRPKVTQHTDTGLQSAEKAELTSQKMLITRLPVSIATYGGYVNISRQDIDFSAPQIMDVVIQDLAANYAIDTEAVVGVALKAASTANTPALTTSSTAAEVTAAVWKAAGTIFTATKGQGRLVLAASPDMMGVIGPLFPSVNPTNANSTGFDANSFGSGPLGAISGVTTIMSAGLASGTVLEFSTAAAEVYEQRIGALQVTEPSVLGVQVAYAGYFAYLTTLAAGILKLTA
jgi:HK97 family phage major capsid protein